MKEEKEKVIKHYSFSPGKVVLGVSAILAGFLLLANNLGLVNLSQIQLDWSLIWPVILIWIGLSMLSTRSFLGGAIGVVFSVFVVLAVLSILVMSGKKTDWGEMVTETREVSGFREVVLTGAGEMEIVQGNKEGVMIEGMEEMVKKIKTEVRGEVLTIDIDEDWRMMWRPIKKLKYTVMLKEIKGIKVSGAGQIIGKDLVADELSVEISGAGRFVMSGKANLVKVKIGGAGSFEGRDLVAEGVGVVISGVGSAEVNATKELEVMISGGGSVRYLGNPTVSKQISGAGSVTRM